MSSQATDTSARSRQSRLALREFIATWKGLGWRRKDGALKNVELWQQLDSLTAEHQIDWRHVTGHSGDTGNERVDVLAKQAVAQLKKGVPTRCQQRGIWQHSLPAVERGISPANG
jgi:ribonuclease HI